MNQYTGLLISLILDALVGWAAGKIARRSGGVIRNIIVGILGGSIGTWIFDQLGWAAGTLRQQIIVSLVGAVVLLVILNTIFGRKKR